MTRFPTSSFLLDSFENAIKVVTWMFLNRKLEFLEAIDSPMRECVTSKNSFKLSKLKTRLDY